jgi:hypothetical protein
LNSIAAGFRWSYSSPAVIKTAAVLLLSIIVSRIGKPWLATLLLTALLVTLDVRDHLGLVLVLIRALIFFVLSGAIFWLVERFESLLMALAIGLAAAAALVFFL